MGKRKFVCVNCGKEFEAVKHGNIKYCSHQCQSEYKRKEYIDKWKIGEVDGGKANGFAISGHVRAYLFSRCGGKCEKCGFDKVNPYTGRSILQIHHIDGNSANNSEGNLQVLCPNCHAMTENFGSRNKNGVSGRSRYFGKAK